MAYLRKTQPEWEEGEEIVTLKEMVKELRAKANTFNKAARLIESMASEKNGVEVVQRAARRFKADRQLHTGTFGTNGRVRHSREEILAIVKRELAKGPKKMTELVAALGLKKAPHLYAIIPTIGRKGRGKNKGLWVAR